MEPLTYKLNLLSYWAIHNVFNVALLKWYTTTMENGISLTSTSPTLEPKPQEKEQTIKDIIAHQLKGNLAQYLVK